MNLLQALWARLPIGRRRRPSRHASQPPALDPPPLEQDEAAQRARQEIEQAIADNERRIAALRSRVRVMGRKPR